MNRALKVGALAAGIGFLLMVFILLFRVRSPLVVNLLWPTHFLANASKGTFWMMTFGTLGFFANAFLYGLIGYGIGKLMYGDDAAKQPPS